MRSGVRSAIVAVAAVVLLAGCANGRLAVDATVPTSTPHARPVVVAIGDSIMKGHGLDADQAWPELIAKDNDWSLTNLACDGAGFVTAGDPTDCDADFSGLVDAAVALHPDLVLISGSSNDLGTDDGDIARNSASVIDSLRQRLPSATIVGISTVWNDTAAPDQVDDINEAVRSAVLDAKGTYLDIGQPLAGHRDWLQSDDVHPTVKGQQVLAKRIADAVRSAKLTL
jgi:lysophospholipase L1-like esterase